MDVKTRRLASAGVLEKVCLCRREATLSGWRHNGNSLSVVLLLCCVVRRDRRELRTETAKYGLPQPSTLPRGLIVPFAWPS